jgi:hypothetical protein
MLVQIRLRGTSGFLMNKRTPHRGLQVSNVRRAEEGAYLDTEGQLYIPASAIKGVMVDAADRHEFVRRGITAEAISAGVFVCGDQVPLFESDGLRRLRSYTMERVRRHLPSGETQDRLVPMAKHWTAVFSLQVGDGVLSLDDVRGLFEVGGRDYGVGYHRPNRRSGRRDVTGVGVYGTFEVDYVRMPLDVSKGAA